MDDSIIPYCWSIRLPKPRGLRNHDSCNSWQPLYPLPKHFAVASEAPYRLTCEQEVGPSRLFPYLVPKACPRRNQRERALQDLSPQRSCLRIPPLPAFVSPRSLAPIAAISAVFVNCRPVDVREWFPKNRLKGRTSYNTVQSSAGICPNVDPVSLGHRTRLLVCSYVCYCLADSAPWMFAGGAIKWLGALRHLLCKLRTCSAQCSVIYPSQGASLLCFTNILQRGKRVCDVRLVHKH